jgi:hypothetical protein
LTDQGAAVAARGRPGSSCGALFTGYLHLKPAAWGLLMSYSALVIVVSQYPIVRAVKRFDPMYQVALASLLFGCGVGRPVQHEPPNGRSWCDLSALTFRP